MIERIRHMLIKEFLQVFRDPKMLRVIFVLPVIQVLIFGYAVTTDVRHVALAVFDQDNSIESREMVARFEKSKYFDVVARPRSEQEVLDVLNNSRATALLRFDTRFGDDLRAGRTAQLQLLLDGTDSNTAGIVANYATRIVGDYSQNVLLERTSRLLGPMRQPGRVEVARRAWFNENLESRNFYVPGVIALVVMLVSLMLTSMAVVREKEIGTMEQIIVTPIRPIEFILGKTAPFALIAMVNVVIISLVAVFWFEIPIRGTVLVLLAGTLLYLLSTLGIGLLISTVSQTQQQAMMSTFLFFLPAMMLSGFLFPIANMPEPVQWLTYVNPLRYFLVVIRAVFLKGTGLDILWPQFLALAIVGIVTFTVAVSRFRKTLA
ncbi:MAG TPA: ABC transporter permease [Terriglobales bacterium]|nr:ABC transporter permease [Terriglobales bacterium]